MQLNFLQEDLLNSLRDVPTAPQKPKAKPAAPAADLFGGLPLNVVAPVSASKKAAEAVPEAPVAEIIEISAKAPGAMKTISEAAEMLGVQQHVLRFWESRFSQIKPLKLRGGRRYYRPEDMEVLSKIQHLLYKQGYTIKGAIKAFSGEKSIPAAKPLAEKAPTPAHIILTDKQRKQVSAIREELLGLRDVLKPYLEGAVLQ